MGGNLISWNSRIWKSPHTSNFAGQRSFLRVGDKWKNAKSPDQSSVWMSTTKRTKCLCCVVLERFSDESAKSPDYMFHVTDLPRHSAQRFSAFIFTDTHQRALQNLSWFSCLLFQKTLSKETGAYIPYLIIRFLSGDLTQELQPRYLVRGKLFQKNFKEGMRRNFVPCHW